MRMTAVDPIADIRMSVHDKEMIRRVGLAALLAFGSPCAAATWQPFFPPDYASLSYSCPAEDGSASNPVQFLSSFEQDWFARHLNAAGEVPLYAAAQSDTARRVLRFTWLRSFHPTVIVRLNERKDGGWNLVAKQLSGRGGYDPGTIDKVVERQLRVTEIAQLEALMAQAPLPDLSGDCVIGLDGAQWIIERSDAKGYHFINRWSPSDGPVKRVGMFVLNLTGWRIKPVY